MHNTTTDVMILLKERGSTSIQHQEFISPFYLHDGGIAPYTIRNLNLDISKLYCVTYNFSNSGETGCVNITVQFPDTNRTDEEIEDLYGAGTGGSNRWFLGNDDGQIIGRVGSSGAFTAGKQQMVFRNR